MAIQKHMTKVMVMAMAATACLCLFASAFGKKTAKTALESTEANTYETVLFGEKTPVSINIIMDEEKWKDMLENASSESYYPCDVEIEGETFYWVGIRPKGNTSLQSIVSDPETDRYSFKLEFDCYIDRQTCYGLDKLVLNNNYSDASGMKEAFVYDMYRYMEADASLYNYAKVSVNGSYWGLYLALEAVEDSFLMRNYGTQEGNLYKPDNMRAGTHHDKMQGEGPENGGRWEGAPRNGKEDAKDGEEMRPRPPYGKEEMPSWPPFGKEGMSSQPSFGKDGMPPGVSGFPGDGFRGDNGGADLNYTDDNLDSYRVIWEGEVGRTSASDRKRVIEALKNIQNREDIEKYADVDNLLKYMAVHAFSSNDDSLSGHMSHNYYLYERDGKLNLLPWDYNLAFGGMGGKDASQVVNDAVDTPFDGTDFFDVFLDNQEYLDKYHAYMSRLVEEYIYGGGFEEFYRRTRRVTDSLTETDPTAFYTYEEYERAVEMFYDMVMLRGQSVRGQLQGTVPSTDSEQKENPQSLVDASAVDLSVMGVMDRERKG